MTLTCPCQHCNHPLEFEAQQAGKLADCPKCGMETRLSIPPPPASLGTQEPTWAALAEAASALPKRPPGPSAEPLVYSLPENYTPPDERKKQIENQLELIGRVFFAFGVLGAIVAGFSFAILCVIGF